jgi:hypothetical protein
MTRASDIFATYMFEDGATLPKYCPGWPVDSLSEYAYSSSEDFRDTAQLVRWQLMSGRKQPSPPTVAVQGLIQMLEKLDALIQAFILNGRQAELAAGRFKKFPRVWRFIEREVLTTYAGSLREQLTPQLYQRLMDVAQRHEGHWACHVR